MLNIPLFHHCRSLANSRFGTVAPIPEYSDPDFLPAYRWLQQQIGFFPLFVAVGKNESDIWNTGYQNQWRVYLGYDLEKKCHVYRRRGKFPNKVLFSFEQLDGMYLDNQWWDAVLNECRYPGDRVSLLVRRCLLKTSWSVKRWQKKALNEPGTVEMVVPKLDLSQASRVWVRNQPTKRKLEALGWHHVEVKRLLIQ